MRRVEKNLLSRQKIISSAMKEFGKKGYGLSSINTICSEGEISKGILYHYFRDKDELYLACVKNCFDGLTEALKQSSIERTASASDYLQSYFDIRLAYFEKNPLQLKLFNDAVIDPPVHIAEAISKTKAEFDRFNTQTLTVLLEKVKLRADLAIEEVVEVLRLYQNFINVKLSKENKDEADFKKREQVCRKSINILLYGVIEREDN